MAEMISEQPFADLPAALVDEVLNKTGGVAEELLKEFQGLRTDRASLRKSLTDFGMIIDDSKCGYPDLPTTCAVDGSYALERLLSLDLAAAAAVAVEGLTPP